MVGWSGMSSRRLARRDAVAPIVPVSQDPHHITQQSMQTPRGEARAWFKGGSCYRVKIAGVPYGWGEAPAVWAAIQDGSFRPNDFGKHNDKGK